MYAKNPEIWERAREIAASQGISLSQYVEQELCKSIIRLHDGEHTLRIA
jgi:predicted HicB family RNase H-like nuclease